MTIKGNKRYTYWEWRNKTVILRWHDGLCRKPKRNEQKSSGTNKLL